MVLNSLNFCLSEKLFIYTPILNKILTGVSNLGCRFFPISTLNISCYSLLACRVSAERSAVKCMGFPLYVICCFTLAAFNILSLCLVFVSLISMCGRKEPDTTERLNWTELTCFSLGYPVWDSVPLGLNWLFLFDVREIFNYNLFKNFLIPFLFLFFFWDPYNLNVGAFDILWDYP